MKKRKTALITGTSSGIGSRDGYEAMMKGELYIVNGMKNKIEDFLGDLLPDTLRAKASAQKHGPVRKPRKTA